MNVANRTLYVADNLPVLRGIDTATVDLIATDPPFNSKRVFNAPLGSKAAKQRFDDRWRWDDVTDEWHDLIAADHPAVKEVIEAAVVIEGGRVADTGIETGTDNSIAAFLTWMAPRVVEMHRVLKPTGSLYLHCDDAANSYLRLLLDAVFGRGNFRNEITWRRYNRPKGSQHEPRRYGKASDTILFYTKGDKHRFNAKAIETPLSDEQVRARYPGSDDKGRYMSGPLLRSPSMGERPNLVFEFQGYTPGPAGWRMNKDKLREVRDQGDFYFTSKGVPRRKFRPESPGEAVNDIWTDINGIEAQGRERTGWRTQKPLALYRRIIEASSNEGDLVLDPFAGCATTCVAAEQLKRQWVGIDIDPVAEDVTMKRLQKETGIMELVDGKPVTVRKSPPRRTDVQRLADDKLRVILWNNQGRRCANPYCTSESLRTEDLDLDHRIPKSRGGADDPTNRIGLCRSCNTRKGAKAWGTFLDEARAATPHPKVGRET